MKPKILLVTDVLNWSGWNRARQMQKYLSDEFHFDVMLHDDVDKNINQLLDYDLYYIMFHSLLADGFVNTLREYQKNILVVFATHNLLKEKWGTLTEQKQYLKDILQGVEFICINNKLAMKRWRGLFSEIGVSRIIYLPEGVDQEIFYQKTKVSDINSFTLCHVGKDIPERNLNTIQIPVAKKTKSEIILNTNNWRNSIPQKQLNDFYNKSSVYLVSSINDGTPNPALECGICARPIISNTMGCLPELIIHGENGFIINTIDFQENTFDAWIEKYSEYVFILKDNLDLLEKMGNNMRETILSDWTWDKILNNKERLILRKAVG